MMPRRNHQFTYLRISYPRLAYYPAKKAVACGAGFGYSSEPILVGMINHLQTYPGLSRVSYTSLEKGSEIPV